METEQLEINGLENYNDAHAHAYRILNKVEERLGDDRDLLSLVKWDWRHDLERMGWWFVVTHKGNDTGFFKVDTVVCDDKFYTECADTVAAWLLLQKTLSANGPDT